MTEELEWGQLTAHWEDQNLDLDGPCPHVHHKQMPVVKHSQECKGTGFPLVQTIQKMHTWLSH